MDLSFSELKPVKQFFGIGHAFAAVKLRLQGVESYTTLV
jgi:hypothetical protein